MKKFLELCLVALLALSLFGCGNGTTTDELAETDPVSELVESATEQFISDCEDALAEAEAVNCYSEDILTELSEPVKITVWNTYYEYQQAAFQEVADGFNEKYKGQIEVEYVSQAYQDYDTNLLNAVRAGEGPNITSRYCSTAAAYVQEGLLVNLLPYINDPTIGIPNYKENIVGKEYEEVTQWSDDSLYVYPVNMTTEVLYYNADLFKELGLEVPTTWTELAEVSKTIYEAKGIPGWGSDSETDTMIDMLIQAGSGYINGKTCKSEVDIDVFKNNLKWYLTGLNEGYFRLAGADQYHSGPFVNGQVAMYCGSSAGVSYVFPNDNFDVGVAAMPQEGGETFCPAWGGGLVVFNKTPEENLASYLFLKYFLEDDVIAKWCTVFGAMPATKSAINTDIYQTWAKENKVGQALIQSADYVNWVNSVPGADNFRNAFGYAVDSCAAALAE